MHAYSLACFSLARASAGTLGAWYKAALTRNAAAVLMRATAGSSGLRLGAFVVRKQSDNVRIHVLSTYQPTRRSATKPAACIQHIRIHVSWLRFWLLLKLLRLLLRLPRWRCLVRGEYLLPRKRELCDCVDR